MTNSNDDALSQIDKKVQSNGKAIQSLGDTVTARLNSIEDRLNSVDDRLNSVDDRIDELVVSVGDTNQQIAIVRQAVDRLAGLQEQTIQAVQREMGSVGSEVGDATELNLESFAPQPMLHYLNLESFAPQPMLHYNR